MRRAAVTLPLLLTLTAAPVGAQDDDVPVAEYRRLLDAIRFVKAHRVTPVDDARLGGYPLTRHEDQQVLIYESLEWDSGERQIRRKTLHVLVNALGLVEDVRFDGSSRPLPPPVATPGVTTVPIYVPTPRRGR